MQRQRMRIASARAVEAQTKLRRIAEQLDRGLDEATPPHGVVSAFLSEEDSMVTSVAEVIQRSKATSTPPPLAPVARVRTKLMYGPQEPTANGSETAAKPRIANGSDAAPNTAPKTRSGSYPTTQSQNRSGSYSIIKK